MRSERSLGPLTLGIGLAGIIVALIVSPAEAPPLYDGTVPAEPYRYVSPASGQRGGPTSFSGTQLAGNGDSPPFAAPTSEVPPQGQLIAPPGAFALPPGTIELRISIAPEAPMDPDQVLGNAYRVVVMNQANVPVPPTFGSPPTLVLRSPPGPTDVTIVRWANDRWEELPTQPATQIDMYVAEVRELGVFAICGRTAAPPPPDGIKRWFVPVGLAVALAIGFILLVRIGMPPPARPNASRPPAATPRRRTRHR